MTTVEQLRQRKNEIVQIARKHGAGNVRVFGSVARGEDSDDSDIDLLIDLVGKPSSWFPSGMALELQDLLGKTRRRLDGKSLASVIAGQGGPRGRPAVKDNRVYLAHIR